LGARTIDPATLALTGLLPFVLIASAILALPLCLFLLWLYRRAVVRSMRGGEADTGGAPLVRQAPSEPEPSRSLAFVDDEAATRLARPEQSRDLLRRARAAPWQAAGVYVLAGLAFAGVLSIALQLTADGRLRPLRSALLAWMLAWPLVIVVRRVAASTRAARLAVAAAYFSLLTVLGAASALLNPDATLLDLVTVWLVTNGPPTLLMLAFLNRRVRAVGPLVIAFVVTALLGSQVALSLASEQARLRLLVEIGSWFRLGAVGVFLAILLVGAAAFAVVGWAALAWIRRRYEAGAVTDQSLEIGAVWLVFGLNSAVNLAFHGTAWPLAAALAVAAHEVVARAGFALLRRRPAARSAPGLLVLRVFALGVRSERLFEAVQRHWRHVGAVSVIAGPDLATSTVEPHEFLDFLTGRLARRFIDGPAALRERLAETTPRRDRDGRFRVAEYFCHGHAWRSVFSFLAAQSDAVLMDLRGFSPEHAGCAFELQTLVQAVPLARIVLVHDGTTDRALLEHTAHQAWSTRPLAAHDREATSLRLVRYRSSGDFPRLLAAVCAAAS
jgi:hypothetical protein